MEGINWEIGGWPAESLAEQARELTRRLEAGVEQQSDREPEPQRRCRVHSKGSSQARGQALRKWYNQSPAAA